jgi:hypothetical protein
VLGSGTVSVVPKPLLYSDAISPKSTLQRDISQLSLSEVPLTTGGDREADEEWQLYHHSSGCR